MNGFRRTPAQAVPSKGRFDMHVLTGISHRKLIAGLIALVAILFTVQLAASSQAHAATVYEGYSRVGSVDYSFSGQYKIKSGYSSIGYTKPSYSGRWDVYRSYSKVGYVKPSYSGRYDIYYGYSRVGYISPSGSKWNVYRSYSKVGYVSGGPGGPAAAAALLLLM